MNSFAICAVFGLIAFAADAGPVVDDSELPRPMDRTNPEEELVKKLNGKCATQDDSSCLVLKSYLLLNRLLKRARIDLGNFEITKTSAEPIAKGGSRSLDGNTTDGEQISQLLFDKVWAFVRTRSLKWKIMDGAEVVISGKKKDAGVNIDLSLLPTKATDDEARKKKNNNMGAILAAAALKIGLLKALALKGIALLVGKALLISKLALVLSAIIGLKKLFSKEKHVTYEVIGHPQQETHHEHSFSNIGGHDSYGGWARGFDGNELAYHAHAS